MTGALIDAASHTPVPTDTRVLVTIDVRRPAWKVALLAFATLTAAGAIGASLVLLTTAALSEPTALAKATADPLSAVQAAGGVALLAALLLIPLSRLVDRLTVSRSVEVTREAVIIRRRGLAGSFEQCEPIAAYSGIASRLKTTLSGVIHEIVLVHADPRRDVVVASDARPDPARLAALARALMLPEVSLRDIRR